MKKYLTIILKRVGLLAKGTLVLSANTTSNWIAHQPKMPDTIKKLKKM